MEAIIIATIIYLFYEAQIEQNKQRYYWEMDNRQKHQE